MKRNLLSFAALAAAVLFSGSVLAKTEKASVSLKFGSDAEGAPCIKAAAYDDYSFKLSVPQTTVDFNWIGVQINGNTEKVVTMTIPTPANMIDLSQKLGRIYSFNGTTNLNVELIAGENNETFHYAMNKVGSDIVATTDDAAPALSLLKTYGEAAGAQGGNLLIKAGSYINYGGERLVFENNFVGTKDIDVLFANFKSSTDLRTSSDNNFEMYLKPGSKLAMGNSGRAFMYETTITMNISGLSGGVLTDLKNSTTLSDFITNTLLFVNDLIGALDAQNDVAVTIEIADPWETLRGAKSVLLPGKDHALTVGEFGTFVCNYDMSDFRGAEVYSINKRDEASTVVDLVEVSSLVAGQPYIFRATSDKLQAIIDWTAQGTYSDANGLHAAESGIFTNAGTYYEIPANDGWYIIKNNVLRLCGNNCGLYEGTAAIKVSEISTTGNVPQHVGKHLRVAVSEDATEGIEDAQAEVAATKMIVNGQLVIVKNGVMYNAAGMQVK